MTTMNEKYGDGSDHEVCNICGFCIPCGDCAAYGCGKKRTEKKAYTKEIAKRLNSFKGD